MDVLLSAHVANLSLYGLCAFITGGSNLFVYALAPRG